MSKKSGFLFSAIGITKLRDRFFLLLVFFPAIALIGLIISAQVTISLKNLDPAMDTTGRQATLVQKMVTISLTVTHEHGHPKGEARETVTEFERALDVLRHGGRAGGNKVFPVPSAVLPHIDDIESHWLPFRQDYEWVIANRDKKVSAGFRDRIEKIKEESAHLMAAVDETMDRLDQHAAHMVNSAIALLSALAAAAIAAFLLAFSVMRRNLLAPLEELTAATEKVSAGDCAFSLTYGEDDEMGMLQGSFARMCATLKKDRDTRKISTDLLTLSLPDETMEGFLKKALDVILSVPWLMLQPRGAIFLAENGAKTLTLKAQRGLHEELLKTCATVPFGRCLCGRAAESGEAVYAQDVDGRHENSYDDIKPHGHYCVPIKSRGTVLGAITLYLEAGHNKDAEELRFLGVVADIMAIAIVRRLAEEQGMKLSAVMKQSQNSVIITDTSGIITYVNPAFEMHSGYTAAEVLGRSVNILGSGQHPGEFYKVMWKTLAAGHNWEGRFINKKKSGALIEMHAVISPVKEVSGKITAYVSIQRDLTDENAMQEQLRQSQKMEAVGRLAGGVAHDFNNILMAIDSYAGFVSPAVKGNAQAEGDIKEIRTSVARATALTRQLLAFSRKQKTVLQPLDLQKSVRESEKLLNRLIGEGIKLEISGTDDMKPVKADPGHIDQVLMNLVVNARDAMPGGGRIEVKTLSHNLTRPVPTPLGIMPPGEYSVVSVRDTGTGMDSETLSKIFEPFFTTKPEGKGTGLGLSIVYGIIKQHGAYMTVASRPGEGSTFTAYFPVLTDSVEELTTAPERAAAIIPPGAAIFLAEDDPALIASITRTLRGLGASVEPFSGPEALLDFLSRYAGKIDLLITDIVMPGMDGFALAERIKKKSPGTAVIYMSGYTDPDIFRGRLEEPGIIFLQKPFPPELLARTVAKALAAKGAA